MATWVKCTDEHGKSIYINLDNAITLFRDDDRHRGTIVAFTGDQNNDVVRETPDQILKLAKGGLGVRSRFPAMPDQPDQEQTEDFADDGMPLDPSKGGGDA